MYLRVIAGGVCLLRRRMTWEGDPRTSTADWRRRRRIVMRRDAGVCYLCGKPGADEVDHKNGDKTDDRLENLGAVHARPCHLEKTLREAQAKRWPAARKRSSGERIARR